MLRTSAQLALEIYSGNISPHCIRLWWFMGLDTRGSWGTLGGWDCCHLWRTVMLCPLSLWNPRQRWQFERIISSRKDAWGVRVGQGSICRRKGRWRTLTQPSLSPMFQVSSKSKCTIPLTDGSALRHFMVHLLKNLLLSRQRRISYLSGRWRLSQLSQPYLSTTGEAPVGASSEHTFFLSGSLIQHSPYHVQPCQPN